MSKQNNPFSDVFANFSAANPFAEAYNWDSIVSAGRANAKAFSDAAKAVTEGAQEFSRRSFAISQKQAEKAQDFFKEVTASASNPEAALAKQTQFVKKAFEEASKNAAELADIAKKANEDAASIITKRITQACDEASSCGNASSSSNKNEKKAA